MAGRDFGSRPQGAVGVHRQAMAFCRYIDRNWPGSRPSVVIRTRQIDDAVTAALEDGAEQLAILGAGYDTRGMRLEAAAPIQVFELDQPPTQDRKKSIVIELDGIDCPNITYVPFDLEDEGVGAPLSRGGFLSGKVTVCVWEGVVSYLTPEAVDQTLAGLFQRERAGQPNRLHLRRHLASRDSARGSGAPEGPPWTARDREGGGALPIRDSTTARWRSSLPNAASG